MDSKYHKMFGINYLVVVENSLSTVRVEFSFVDLELSRKKFDELFNRPRIGVDTRLTPITSEEVEREFVDFVYSK